MSQPGGDREQSNDVPGRASCRARNVAQLKSSAPKSKTRKGGAAAAVESDARRLRLLLYVAVYLSCLQVVSSRPDRTGSITTADQENKERSELAEAPSLSLAT